MTKESCISSLYTVNIKTTLRVKWGLSRVKIISKLTLVFLKCVFPPTVQFTGTLRVKVPHGETGPATSGYPVLIWLGFNAISLPFFPSSTVLVQQFTGVIKEKHRS